MKLLTYLTFLLLFLMGCSAKNSKSVIKADEPFKWYTIEEAAALNKIKPKKIMVDVYTDWCGWCKKMDKSTFSDEEVKKYLATNFYAVKLNAEQKEDIKFSGETFKWKDMGNGRGVNEFAHSLLEGKMGYPTVVYLNEKYERIMISPGYKEVADILLELRFASEEQYNKTTWDEFKEQY